MAIDLMAPVSARQFVKMVGISSDYAARKAVERGSIVKGYNPVNKTFIPKVAAQEWGKDILPEFGGKGTKPTAKPASPAKRKKVTADDVVKKVLDSPSGDYDDDDLEDDEEHPPGWVSKPEAERRSAIHKSEILEIALAEKRAQLIPKEKISSVLFAYGQEVRVAVEGITNRVLDKILASTERHEAKRILDEEIHVTLTMLSEMPNRKI